MGGAFSQLGFFHSWDFFHQSPLSPVSSTDLCISDRGSIFTVAISSTDLSALRSGDFRVRVPKFCTTHNPSGFHEQLFFIIYLHLCKPVSGPTGVSAPPQLQVSCVLTSLPPLSTHLCLTNFLEPTVSQVKFFSFSERPSASCKTVLIIFHLDQFQLLPA